MDGRLATSKRKAQLQRHVDLLHSCRKCPNMQSRPRFPAVRFWSQSDARRTSAWRQRTHLRDARSHGQQGKQLPQMVRTGNRRRRGAVFRQTVYMAAVCRCFPGKNSQGGDRVPSKKEVELCGEWLRTEIAILEPGLVIAVGKLANGRFLLGKLPVLTDLVGQIVRVHKFGRNFDLVPLPHPSGASPWHQIEPGKTLTKKALALIGNHPAWIGRV